MARNPLSCGAKCSRISLISLNVIFLLLGIAIFVLGLIFRFGGSHLKEDLKLSFEKIFVSDYNLYDLLNSISILFIIVGAIIMGFSILGFVGAICYVRPVLITYAILVGLWLAVELAGIILFFVVRNELNNSVKMGMKTSVIEAQAEAPNGDTRMATENMFKMYECCHVDGVRLNTTTICAMNSDNYNKDCYDSFSDWLKQFQMPLVGICIAVMIVQLMLITCACWLCRASSKSGNIV